MRLPQNQLLVNGRVCTFVSRMVVRAPLMPVFEGLQPLLVLCFHDIRSMYRYLTAMVMVVWLRCPAVLPFLTRTNLLLAPVFVLAVAYLLGVLFHANMSRIALQWYIGA